MIDYDTLYAYLSYLANYKIHDYYACRLLALIALVLLLYISRITSNNLIKVFSIVTAIILYNAPAIVGMFSLK
jgi:hypothetical protein